MLTLKQINIRKYNEYDGSIDVITAQGHIIDFDRPYDTVIDLKDIREHISNIRRFNGAIDVTLMHHLALAVKLSDWCLIRSWRNDGTNPQRRIQNGYCAAHDFSEVYVGDIVTGLKRRLPGYKKLENKFDEHLHNKLGMPLKYRDYDHMKKVDTMCLALEMIYADHPAADRVCNKLDYNITDEMNEIAREIISLNTSKITHNRKLWKIIVEAIEETKRWLPREDNGDN